MNTFKLLLAVGVVGAAMSLDAPSADASYRHGFHRGYRHGFHRGHGFRGHFYRPHFHRHYVNRGFYHRPWRSYAYRGYYHRPWHSFRSYGWYPHRYVSSYRSWGYYPRSYFYYQPRVYVRPVYGHWGWYGSVQGQPAASSSVPQAEQYRAHAVQPAPRVSQSYVSISSPVDYKADGAGWEFLAERRFHDAKLAFVNESKENPRAGGPRIGYALAAAGNGDLVLGMSTMRDACRADPLALQNIELSAELRPQVLRLVSRYIDELPKGRVRRDPSFMLATLHYLVGDTRAAAAAVDRAIAFGDRGAYIAELDQMIAKKAQQQETIIVKQEKAQPREVHHEMPQFFTSLGSTDTK